MDADDSAPHAGAGAVPLQFEVAGTRADAAASARTCAGCQTPITVEYYTVNGQAVCAACRDAVMARPAGSRAGRAFRASLFGGLAALGGAILYFAVAALTGYEFAIVAIVVGFAVGKAVRHGSGNRGGRAYQLLAVGLTYFAIVSTYIPLAVRELAKSNRAAVDSVLAVADSAGARRDSLPGAHAAEEFPVIQAGTPAGSSPSRKRIDTPVVARRLGAGAIVIGVVALLAFAAAAPVLAGFSNVIGLLILAIAVYQAWKLNRRATIVVSGPYQLGAEPGV